MSSKRSSRKAKKSKSSKNAKSCEKTFTFLHLPPELRTAVYQILFDKPATIAVDEESNKSWSHTDVVAILQTSRAIRSEALPYLLSHKITFTVRDSIPNGLVPTLFASSVEKIVLTEIAAEAKARPEENVGFEFTDYRNLKIFQLPVITSQPRLVVRSNVDERIAEIFKSMDDLAPKQKQVPVFISDDNEISAAHLQILQAFRSSFTAVTTDAGQVVDVLTREQIQCTAVVDLQKGVVVEKVLERRITGRIKTPRDTARYCHRNRAKSKAARDGE